MNQSQVESEVGFALEPSVLVLLHIPVFTAGAMSTLLDSAISKMVLGPPFCPTCAICCCMPSLSVFGTSTIWPKVFFPLVALLRAILILVPLISPFVGPAFAIPELAPPSMPSLVPFLASFVRTPFCGSVGAVSFEPAFFPGLVILFSIGCKIFARFAPLVSPFLNHGCSPFCTGWMQRFFPCFSPGPPSGVSTSFVCSHGFEAPDVGGGPPALFERHTFRTLSAHSGPPPYVSMIPSFDPTLSFPL
mmetsp:Transcript_4478/g.28528  ORF Transcript_4478/g.28528 Transcript_4478/m.28528 type:complete len:247 (-) Transcript_4478:487-1227(-)